MNVLLDTNVFIHVLNRTEQRAVDFVALLNASERVVSPITWIELLVGAREREAETRALLYGFLLIPIDIAIMERAVFVRKQTRLKLPDAVIYASALVTGRTLVTYNTRDFPLGTPSVFCPAS